MAKKTRNTRSKAVAAVAGGLALGEITKMEDIELTGRVGSAQYDALWDQMGKMRPGDALPVPLPEGTTFEQIQGRINGAKSRTTVKPPEGHRFVMRRSKDGKALVICLIKGVLNRKRAK